MRFQPVTLALFALAFAPLQVAAPPPFRVAGYLPEYHAAGYQLDGKRLTDLILFSAEPTAAGRLDTSRLAKLPWADLRAAKTRERVRLILGVGGWNRSAHFAAAAGSDASCKAFAESAVQICLAERLDGVDLDWEHPKTEAEEGDYADLLVELRRAFTPHGLVLSVSIAAWQNLPPRGFAAVDWVNLMSYDDPGRHSTFEGAEANVKKLTDKGVPAGKITLGIPFYGRDVAKRERTAGYREIVGKYHPQPGTDEIDGLYFNGPATVRRKTEFARKTGLAGVVVWELGQDAAGNQSLLNVIRAAADAPR